MVIETWSHWSRRLQQSSGNMLACGAGVPRFEVRCGQKVFVFFTKITVITSFGHGLNTLQCLGGLSLPPSEGGKSVSTLWLSTNTNGNGQMFGL